MLPTISPTLMPEEGAALALADGVVEVMLPVGKAGGVPTGVVNWAGAVTMKVLVDWCTKNMVDTSVLDEMRHDWDIQ